MNNKKLLAMALMVIGAANAMENQRGPRSKFSAVTRKDTQGQEFMVGYQTKAMPALRGPRSKFSAVTRKDTQVQESRIPMVGSQTKDAVTMSGDSPKLEKDSVEENAATAVIQPKKTKFHRMFSGPSRFSRPIAPTQTQGEVTLRKPKKVEKDSVAGNVESAIMQTKKTDQHSSHGLSGNEDPFLTKLNKMYEDQQKENAGIRENIADIERANHKEVVGVRKRKDLHEEYMRKILSNQKDPDLKIKEIIQFIKNGQDQRSMGLNLFHGRLKLDNNAAVDFAEYGSDYDDQAHQDQEVKDAQKEFMKKDDEEKWRFLNTLKDDAKGLYSTLSERKKQADPDTDLWKGRGDQLIEAKTIGAIWEKIKKNMPKQDGTEEKQWEKLSKSIEKKVKNLSRFLPKEKQVVGNKVKSAIKQGAKK